MWEKGLKRQGSTCGERSTVGSSTRFPGVEIAKWLLPHGPSKPPAPSQERQEPPSRRHTEPSQPHLILSILLDEEGQVPGRGHEHIGCLLWSQEGKDPGHQTLSFPDAHDLHEVVIARPEERRKKVPTLTWEHPRVIPWLDLPQHQVENTPMPQKTSLRREK